MINPFERGIEDAKKIDIIYRQKYIEVIIPYQNYLNHIINKENNDSVMNAISYVWNQQKIIYDKLIQKRKNLERFDFSRRKRLGFKIIAQAKILEDLTDPELVKIEFK